MNVPSSNLLYRILVALTAIGCTAAQAGAPPAFQPCSICHSVAPGHNGVGPTLFGVVGRKAGTASGYHYSAAMLSFAKVWDHPTLDLYLSGPARVVPGTKMGYPGVPNPADRAAIIDYLATLK
jgi:cytochrome c2